MVPSARRGGGRTWVNTGVGPGRPILVPLVILQSFMVLFMALMSAQSRPIAVLAYLFASPRLDMAVASRRCRSQRPALDAGVVSPVIEQEEESGEVDQPDPAPSSGGGRGQPAQKQPVPISKLRRFLRDRAAFGDVRACERLFKELQQREEKVGSTEYNALMLAYARTGNSRGADRVFQRMTEGGVAPTRTTFNTMIHSFILKRRPDLAETWFNNLVEAGLEPDLQSYIGVINAYATDCDPFQAEAWFERMKAAGLQPDVKVYGAVMKAHSNDGNVQAVEDWLERMQASGVPPDEGAYGAAIHACRTAGDVERAQRLVQAMEAAGVRASKLTFSLLLNVASEAGDVERVRDILARIRERGAPNVIDYNAAIHAVAVAGPEAEGQLFGILQDMVTDNVSPNRRTLTDLRAAVGERQARRLCQNFGWDLEAVKSRARPNARLLRRQAAATRLPEGGSL